MESDDQLRRRFEGLEAELLPQVRGVGLEELRRRGRQGRHARWSRGTLAAAVLVGVLVLARSWLGPSAQPQPGPIGPGPSVTAPVPNTVAGGATPTTAGTASSSTTAPQGAGGIAGMRWQHGSLKCGPYVRPVINRSWQFSAPRQAVAPGASVTLSLRNKQAPGNVPGPHDPELYKPAPDVVIEATVVFPDGGRHQSRPLRLDRSSQQVSISYPDDFPGAPPVSALGDYTVLWTTGGGFLACDGFQVARR